jgi:hypothetical protein
LPIGFNNIEIDEVRYSFGCFSNVVKYEDMLAFMGELTTFSRYFIGLHSNESYWIKACSKVYGLPVVCDYSFFNTSDPLDYCNPPPEGGDNLVPDVKLFGTDSGWVTSNSSPEIIYVISDDSQIGWDCSLYVDGFLDTTFEATSIQGLIQVNQTLSENEYMISMTCSDFEGATGSSDIYVLKVLPEFNYLPFSFCAYDNDTAQPLNGLVLVTDEGGHIIFNEPFESCFSREIVEGYGSYYDVSVFVPSYLTFSQRVSPPVSYSNVINLTAFQTNYSLPQEQVLNCTDLRVDETYEISFMQEKCEFTVWRCSSTSFPSSCEIIGFSELFGSEQAFFKVGSSNYFGDYIVLQGSCEPSITCFHILSKQIGVPGFIINLAKEPQQGYFIVILIILVGILKVTVGK